VVHSVIAQLSKIALCVYASMVILGRRLTASQAAWLAQNVHQIKLVLIKGAQILVQVYVHPIPIAGLLIIRLYVFVNRVLVAIL